MLQCILIMYTMLFLASFICLVLLLGYKENHGPGDRTKQGATKESSSMQPNYPLLLTCSSGDNREDDLLNVSRQDNV